MTTTTTRTAPAPDARTARRPANTSAEPTCGPRTRPTLAMQRQLVARMVG